MSQKLVPPHYLLTLTDKAFRVFAETMVFKRLHVSVRRPDGKIDIAISHSLYDQLQTAALPRENLSDTIIRIGARR